ncbi:hypothetical protein [Plesiocystis pacifica]|nr:hypothetical protein [Plesiocystis pacifica]
MSKGLLTLIVLSSALGCAGGGAEEEGKGPGNDVVGNLDEADDDATSMDDDEQGDDGETGPKLDIPDDPPPEGESGQIWIANSNQGTVSKIDTQTMEELGRYITRPDGVGSPSRTSVSLTGNMAVANREGGITKIYGKVEDCVDANMNGEIDTSTGQTDILPWGEDECIAWYVPMDYTSQRAVAWTRGEGDPENGESITNEKVWVTGDNEANAGVDVMLLNGETGAIESMVTVGINAPGSSGWPYRAYGGAVDRDSNFWFTSHGEQGVIVRVNIADMSYDQWPKDHWSYGITVDSKGRPWSCEAFIGRFDPETGTWATTGAWDWNFPGLTEVDQGGCMVDGEGRLWASVLTSVGSGFGVVAIDGETLEPIVMYEIPDHAHGISIDFEGYVWGVARADVGPSDGTEAYKIDPETGEYQIFSGLVGAYTYSDMTGFALNATVAPPIE